MKYYHGSIVTGLTELIPQTAWYNNLPEPLVYLTTSRQLALHYIWDMGRIGVKMPMLDIRKDGTLVFQEMFSGALEYFYKGVSGCIYCCEGDLPINPDSRVPTCATSATTIPITKCELIDDVYTHICSYAEKGTFIYERYEELPQWRKDVIRGHVMRFIKKNNLLDDPAHPSRNFIQEKFSQYWKEAAVLHKHDLF